MVDKLNRTEAVSAANISRYKKPQRPEKNQIPKVSQSLVNEIINELRADKDDITPQTVQHKVIVKALMNNFGYAATTEPKFKKLYEHINRQFSKDEQVQALIVKAIERYG